jgi:hypothetical protein
MLRKCRECGLEAHNEEELELFMKCNAKSRHGRKQLCKECNNNKCRTWRKTDKAQNWQQEYDLQRKYNISIEVKKDMYVLQDGTCAICLKSITFNNAFVDHNHETGEVRGLLCTCCNIMLGQAQDSSEILMRGMQYLEERGTYDRTRT